MRLLIGVAAFAAMSVGSARADTLPVLLEIPATYTPGTSFSFEVRAPGLPDFDGFIIDITFNTDVVNPDLTLSAAPGGAQSPFPGSTNFSSLGTVLPDTTAAFLTFSDSGPPTFTTPGVKDLLAIVTVTPGLAMTGPITITVESTTILSFNMEGQPPVFLPDPITVEQAQGPGPTPDPTPVPVPAGAVSLAIGGLLLLGRNRWKRGR